MGGVKGSKNTEGRREWKQNLNTEKGRGEKRGAKYRRNKRRGKGVHNNRKKEE